MMPSLTRHIETFDNGQHWPVNSCVIATKHGKESVIGPMVKKTLGIDGQTVAGLDTDLFGTFSGEAPRQHDALTTAKLKAAHARSMSGASMAIASEGSFGPHPTIPFVSGNTELIFFEDVSIGLELYATHTSTSTNFAHSEIDMPHDLTAFALKAGFPSHGLILKGLDETGNANVVRKGITSMRDLLRYFREIQRHDLKVMVETDMRAYLNPTRMKVIEEATLKLIGKYQSKCPGCNAPGFDVKAVIRGLPCRLCQQPTDTPKTLIKRCWACDYEMLIPYGSSPTEDPVYCNFCNP